MLPNVRVSIAEEVTQNVSTFNTFLPLVILKTKTGPIGTEVLVNSVRAFANTFGTPDASTPEAFGVYQYIRNYGQAYVVRVASDSATEATGKITSGTGSSAIDLVTIKSVYKTDELNGKDVSLVYDNSNNKLYLTLTVGDTVINSIKETVNYSTITADELEAALNKIISSFNEAQNYVVLENKFVDKTEEDDKPEAFTELKGTLTGGVNGNTSISDATVNALIEKYRGSDLGIDAILAPGFESAEVINKLAAVAKDSSFIAIASLSGNATAIVAATNSIIANSSLVLYADKVRLVEDTSIEVPSCIAVLPAYITRNQSSKWLAPAGVTRGTLSFVASTINSFGDSDLETLYLNTIPVNGLKKISGRGYIVWGQKTADQDSSQYQDRVNVVRLCKYLTKEIYNISYDYLFEPITNYTYNAWTLRVESLLDEVEAGSGLSAYKVIMDDTINTEETKKANKLVGIVRFKPLEAAEYIEIEFVVTDNVEGGNV